MLKRILLAAWLAAFAVLPAFATTVVPLDLAQIIDQSAVAFQGTAIDNKTGRDPQTGFIVTFTTFRVDDVLKGDVSATHTIKQIGGESASEDIKYKVHGVPTFKIGQSYVVFLPGTSSAGFSSPVGLSQGKFNVEGGDAGLEVGNGNDFRDLTSRMAPTDLGAQAKARIAQDRPVRRMGLDDFKKMVRSHAGSKP